MISKTCNLVLSDLYSYDAVACSYNILKSVGWDLRDIDATNKERRNIQIGKLQMGNSVFSSLMIEQTNFLVDYNLKINNVKENEIITIQRDGVILTRPLKQTSTNFSLRSIISKMILSIDRKSYLLIHSDGTVEVKGVRDKPINISFYNMFSNLNFYDKKLLLRSINFMRNSILNSNTNSWFAIEDGDSVSIKLIGIGKIKLSKSSLSVIKSNEIDKIFIWEDYVWPFIQPLLLYCQ